MPGITPIRDLKDIAAISRMCSESGDHEIESTPSADQDPDSIISYLIKEIGSTNAASDFLDEVDACYARLVKMSFMYEMCRDRRLKASGCRIGFFEVPLDGRKINHYNICITSNTNRRGGYSDGYYICKSQ